MDNSSNSMDTYFFQRQTNLSFFDNPEFRDCKIHDFISEISNLEKDKREGIVNCPKCKSSNTIFKIEQRRRADEAPTVSLSCNDCGFKTKDF